MHIFAERAIFECRLIKCIGVRLNKQRSTPELMGKYGDKIDTALDFNCD